MKRFLAVAIATVALTVTSTKAAEAKPYLAPNGQVYYGSQYGDFNCFIAEIDSPGRIIPVEGAPCEGDPIWPSLSAKLNSNPASRDYYHRMNAGIRLALKGNYHNALVNFRQAYKHTGFKKAAIGVIAATKALEADSPMTARMAWGRYSAIWKLPKQ